MSENALTNHDHERFMQMALTQARQASEEGEVPTGCVIVNTDSKRICSGRLIGRAHNQVECLRDPTAHAEMIAITQAASAMGDWRLQGTALYVTKEPCAMCAGAIVLARIPLVVYGASDPQRGGAESVFSILNHPKLNHRCRVISGVMQEECAAILKAFFIARRRENAPTKDTPNS